MQTKPGQLVYFNMAYQEALQGLPMLLYSCTDWDSVFPFPMARMLSMVLHKDQNKSD